MSDAKRNGAAARRKNVQVAVRIRPLNERERSEGARMAATANSVTGCIVVRERNSRKEFGPFDRVYDGSCKQHDIYSALVKPLVPQLLQGYNATIFAYGQTGTGKTFTMAGESDPSHNGSWQDDPGMGIIPRALQQLFDELDAQNAEEYSVRVSYVELYNEELFDLLARPGSEHQRLRIFEDNARKGAVIINGVEDVSVQCSDDVYEVLRRGAEKRRTAATLMNMTSSRSHSVFTVTVVTREGKLPGEDLMRTGKLHLVDLAGSENIGRSGAVDQRAREAGNINQSLLTLGRVITSLTTGAAHVPYRESKLTRILQDSLGGKTITTIIATLSPSSTNTEETINTLEYASRAKNIKNHPEANQTLSRRALLKAYNDEVERLKRDLQAAREKNGVFIDQDNFDKMQEELNAQRDQLEDFTDRIQAYMSQIEKLMNDAAIMDDQYAKLYDRSSQLESRLRERRDEIEQLNMKLAETESCRDKWKRAAEEMQENFRTLQAQNQELRTMTAALSADLDGAHGKIDRLTALIAANESRLKTFEDQHEADAADINGKVESWKGEVSLNSSQVIEKCGTLQSSITEQCSSCKELLWILEGNSEQLLSKLLSSQRIFCESLEGLGAGYSEEILQLLKSTDAAVSEFRQKSVLSTENLRSNLSRMSACQEEFAAVFQDFVKKALLDEDKADKERGQANKRVLKLLKNFVENLEKEQAACLEVEKERRIMRESAVAELSKKRSEMSDVMGSLFTDLEKENHTTAQNAAMIVNAICQDNATLATKSASWKETTIAEAEKYSESFANGTSEYSAFSKETLSGVGRMIGDIDFSSVKMLGEASHTASSMMEISESDAAGIHEGLTTVRSKVRRLVNEEIERPLPTGDTPKRMKYVFNGEIIDAPDVEEMVAGWRNQESPRRQSFYRLCVDTTHSPVIPGGPQRI